MAIYWLLDSRKSYHTLVVQFGDFGTRTTQPRELAKKGLPSGNIT